MSRTRPRVVARWRMTANGVAQPLEPDARPRLQGLDAQALEASLELHARVGAEEVIVEGRDAIAAAFACSLVDAVTCWVEPALAFEPTSVVVAGAGAASMDEAIRLVQVQAVLDGDLVRIDAEVRLAD